MWISRKMWGLPSPNQLEPKGGPGRVKASLLYRVRRASGQIRFFQGQEVSGFRACKREVLFYEPYCKA